MRENLLHARAHMHARIYAHTRIFKLKSVHANRMREAPDLDLFCIEDVEISVQEIFTNRNITDS